MSAIIRPPYRALVAGTLTPFVNSPLPPAVSSTACKQVTSYRTSHSSCKSLTAFFIPFSQLLDAHSIYIHKLLQPWLDDQFRILMPKIRHVSFFAECDAPVPGIFHFFGGIGKKWYRKKVPEPVSVKFGTGKKSRNRYRKNLVPEKVSEPVSEKFGTGTDLRRQEFRNFEDF